MVTVAQHIASTDSAVCTNIATLATQRDLLSVNVLSQLRNLVEGVAVRVHTGSDDTDYDYQAIVGGLAQVKATGQLRFVAKFHDLLLPSASHYTFDGDASERLMLKYYEYLHRLRALAHDKCGIDILGNLEDFPLDEDPALAEYHEQIADELDKPWSGDGRRADRYYIHKTRPFFTNGRIYYEVTFYKAVNRASKADRVVAFTDIDITDNYSATLTLQAATIDVFGRPMPITLVRGWRVSIRPWELNNFARLVGLDPRVRTDSREYAFVMDILTTGRTLLDLVDATPETYADLRARGTASTRNPQIFPAIDEARRIVRGKQPGHNLLRYLLFRMRNEVLKRSTTGRRTGACRT